MKQSFFLVLISLLYYSTTLYSQIIISEIMFNPTGNERYNEVIELYNSSSDEAIDLSGWIIGDGEKSSALVPHQNGLVIAPGQYGIILVPNYFTESRLYDTLIPDSALVITTTSTQFGAYGLANDRGETVTLYKPDSSIACSRQYHVPNEDGISDEKKLLSGNDEDLNWGHSLFINGTPGMKNSIAPKEYDAALNKESIQILPALLTWGAPLTISVSVENTGANSIQNITVFFAIRAVDAVHNNACTDSVKIPLLKPFNSTSIQKELHNIPAGVDSLFITLVQNQDQDPANNFYCCELLCGYPERALVMNEIMYDPLPGNTEWVELFNPQTVPVTIKGWQISDGFSTKTTVFSDSLQVVQPQEFLVIAKDTTIFTILNNSTPVMVCKSFPSLGNDTDSLIIYDGAGSVIDLVTWNSTTNRQKGHSLERINPNTPSGYKNNWYYCQATNGHTAGTVNSAFTKEQASTTKLNISPNPFSPDNDGSDDLAAIQYHLSELTTTINIRIFDIKGRQVRFLQNNQAAAANGTVFWDGRDDEGLCCRVGIYIVFLEAKNSGNKWLEQAYGTVVLAKKL